MRLNAEVGSARKIDVKGYFAGGKTGTANKVINGRYAKDVVFNTFTAIAPADDPKYLFLTLYDEPQGIPETHGYRTGGLERRLRHRQDHRTGFADPRPAAAQEQSVATVPVVARSGYGLPSNGRKWR